MNSISIRPAGSEDLAAIPGIELAAATLFAEADLPHTVRHKVTAPRDLRDALERGQLWVAVAPDDRVVGFAMAGIVDGHAYLDELDVLPEFGRRGIGTRLVETVADWARAGHHVSVSLVTFRHLRWNAPFYEKLGFSALNSSEHGAEIAGLLREEKRAGIDVARRVVMRMDLQKNA